MTLSNLFDVSVSDVWIRFKTLPTRPSRLHGFKRCVESYLLDAAAFTENHQPQPLIPQPASSYFQLLKERVSDLMNDSSSFWEERPLTQVRFSYLQNDLLTHTILGCARVRRLRCKLLDGAIRLFVTSNRAGRTCISLCVSRVSALCRIIPRQARRNTSIPPERKNSP